MADILKKTWNLLGSVHVTVILLLLLVVDVGAGFFSLRSHTILFKPLHDLGIWEWVKTYGTANLSHTAWFFVFLIVLFLLCVNTFVCTTDKVFMLLKNRRRFPDRIRFILRFSPHIIHYALLIILLGYLASYTFTRSDSNRVLLPGKSIQISHFTGRIQLESLNIQYYEGDRLDFFKGRAINADATLVLTDGNQAQTKTVSINKPVWFKGFSIHLKDFAPRTRSGMKRIHYVTLIIKKDPGVYLYFIGMFLFAVGLFMYLYMKVVGSPSSVVHGSLKSN